MVGFLRRNLPLIGIASAMAAFLGSTAIAGATAIYDVTPVVTGTTADLTANLPVILGAVGALIALSIAVRAVRKFLHV